MLICFWNFVVKAQIVSALGEVDLELPVRINAALAANDRIKYYFSLLQMAAARADLPEKPVANLRRERVSCGIDDTALDDTVSGSRRENEFYFIPGCRRILSAVASDLRSITAAVADQPFTARAESLISEMPAAGADTIPVSAISAITQAGDANTDSLHRLLIDLHKALNAIQQGLAEERIDGAAVYRIADSDRPAIAAFMAGLNRTAPLKFSHPGLSTTATRSGARLVIQNDLGTTDAHVLIIHVTGLTVELIYSDVHPERVEFLRRMFNQQTSNRFSMQWTGERSGNLTGESYQLVTGNFAAADPAGLLAFLEFLGSRLVFLIDWNRARKEVRPFLKAEHRLDLLQWAAAEDVGHRAFLELGGAGLINQAIESAAGSAIHFGDRLCDVLGDGAALDFVRFAFRAACDCLRQQQSRSLLHDRLQAELQSHFRSEGTRLLDLARDHAGLIFEIAALVRDGVLALCECDTARLAHRASGFEHNADQAVAAAREATLRRPEYGDLFQIVETADDAADELEEVAFLLEMLAETHAAGPALEALVSLASLIVEHAQEWVKALSDAVQVSGRAATPEDSADFLTAIDRILALERDADAAERALIRAAIRGATDFRQLHLFNEIARSLESAADSLKWAGLTARDYILENAPGA